MKEEEKLNAIKEDMQKGNSPFDADEVFNKKMECYPSNAADTLEETFKKRHSDLVCGKEPLSPFFDLFSEGYELAETEGEKNNKLLKSLLYCTVRSCNNCGKVNCENFQRQRIDCCGLWVSYKDYITKLEKQIEKMKCCANCEFQYVRSIAAVIDDESDEPCCSCKEHSNWKLKR